MTENDAIALARALGDLTTSQKGLIRAVIAQLQLPHVYWRNPSSDWVTDEVLDAMGDALLVHHSLSRQPLTKDRFEFAFERALNIGGIPAKLEVNRTNRGHDITIASVPVSLKTEAAASIQVPKIHISKWMELGKGEWVLKTQRDVFLEHMRNYKRIFTLRCLSAPPKPVKYELVEIPKKLLLESKNCTLVTQEKSKQNPKPGYGYVYDANQALKFALYFDGGTERKLQIKHLQKSFCKVHATWSF